MLDYQTDLQQDVPGVAVEAAVSRQWSEGEEVLQQLRAEGQLGSVVVVALGTNGPITDADFDAMMSILAGASRVVFVNIVVDKPWQDPNNEVLSSGVARYPNTVLANWYALESQNPGWVYSDGTHLPIGGPGAQALAAPHRVRGLTGRRPPTFLRPPTRYRRAGPRAAVAGRSGWVEQVPRSPPVRWWWSCWAEPCSTSGSTSGWPEERPVDAP